MCWAFHWSMLLWHIGVFLLFLDGHANHVFSLDRTRLFFYHTIQSSVETLWLETSRLVVEVLLFDCLWGSLALNSGFTLLRTVHPQYYLHIKSVAVYGVFQLWVYAVAVITSVPWGNSIISQSSKHLCVIIWHLLNSPILKNWLWCDSALCSPTVFAHMDVNVHE